MLNCYVLCDSINPSYIDGDIVAEIRGFDENNREVSEFVRGATDSIFEKDGKSYLFIGLIRQNPVTKQFLIQFPTESDSGSFRIWVASERILINPRTPVHQ